MARIVGIGNQDFERIIANDNFYVDKKGGICLKVYQQRGEADVPKHDRGLVSKLCAGVQ